jgi:pimeloyl-ACP methyl ester carboxylesterase
MQLFGQDEACKPLDDKMRFDATVVKGKGCYCEYPVAGYIDGMAPGHTPPYAARFKSEFSLEEVERELRQQMCEWYFKADAHPPGTDCTAWITEHVRIEDGPMVTARAGNAANPLVVFIHGWPDSPALWVNQFMGLSDQYHCVAVQLPNYLPALPLEELYLDEVVSRIGEVIGDQKAYLVGHDWGANFGYMTAYKFPKTVMKYAALDIGNDIQMWKDTQESWAPMASFISFYQKKLGRCYRHPEEFESDMTVKLFAATGGSPSGVALARMGMYYDRAWKRDEFCKRLAPDVALDDWKSLWTPLGGTGIPQKGMLYIQGSNLATTDKFLEAVREDGGRITELMDAGHWIPKGGAKKVNEELVSWLSIL